MRLRKEHWLYLFAFGLLFEHAGGAIAQHKSNAAAADASTLAVASDNKHDFDFELGRWKAHTWRRQRPLAGSNTWDQYDGVEVVRSAQNKVGIQLEFHADGPAGHLEGLSLRVYESSSQRWILYYSNAVVGAALIPAMGVFKNGQAEFYDQETYNGKAIVVRSVCSAVTSNARYLERSFSDDGGRTWEVNLITTYTRLQDAAS